MVLRENVTTVTYNVEDIDQVWPHIQQRAILSDLTTCEGDPGGGQTDYQHEKPGGGEEEGDQCQHREQVEVFSEAQESGVQYVE